jgi:hypothetical protein
MLCHDSVIAPEIGMDVEGWGFTSGSLESTEYGVPSSNSPILKVCCYQEEGSCWRVMKDQRDV